MVRQPEWLTVTGEESVVWTGQPRTMSIAGTVVWALVRTGVLVALGLVLAGVISVPAGPAAPVLDLLPAEVGQGLAGVAVLWALLQLTWAALVLTNVDYVLTDRNVYKKTGVASERVKRVGLDRIQSTSLKKDLFGNLFDYGSVAISTAGGSGVEMTIADLDDPDELRGELRPLVNEAGSGGTGGGGGRVAGANEELLEEIVLEAQDLRDTVFSVEEVLEQ